MKEYINRDGFILPHRKTTYLFLKNHIKNITEYKKKNLPAHMKIKRGKNPVR